MNPSHTTAVTLPGHQIRRLNTPARVRTERGLLWITVDGRPEDILLAAGESRRFARDERVIVYALGGEARFEVSGGAARGRAQARGWADRLAGALVSWLRGAPPTLGSGA